MRGISKPWPPTDVYPDDQASASLRKAEGEYLARLRAARDWVAFARAAFDDLAKQKLRVVMYREQRSLCVYCERRIAEGHPAPRIDHWYPLSRDPARALQWGNLYLSCPKPETCDSAKGDHPFRWDADSHMPWPVDFRYEEVVGFTSDGRIYVRADVTLAAAIRRALELAIADRADGERVRPGILNLNHQALVKARMAAVRGERKRMERDFVNRTATRSERENRASELLGRRPLPEFVSVRVSWLRRRHHRGR